MPGLTQWSSVVWGLRTCSVFFSSISHAVSSPARVLHTGAFIPAHLSACTPRIPTPAPAPAPSHPPAVNLNESEGLRLENAPVHMAELERPRKRGSALTWQTRDLAGRAQGRGSARRSHSACQNWVQPPGPQIWAGLGVRRERRSSSPWLSYF